MLETLKQIIIDVTTTATGKDACYAKIKGWIAYFFGTGMAGYETIVHHVQFDIEKYFTAVGLLLAAVGANIIMKKGDEPAMPVTPAVEDTQ